MSDSVTLFDIIAWIESRGNFWAIRFEPHIFQTWNIDADNLDDARDRCREAHNCTHETAHVIMSCSFGATQVMGFNLYSEQVGYTKSIGEFFGSRDDQQAVFYSFLNWKNLNVAPSDLLNADTRNNFAKVYNGSIENYAPLILESLTRHGIS